MISVDPNSMVEFITYLVEASGLFTVLTDRTIQNNKTRELVTFDVANKVKAPLRIFKEGDPVQGYAYLQPFREYSTNSHARKWFYDLCTDTPIIILKDLMIKAAELAAAKDTTNQDSLEIINKILDKTDKTTADEIRKIAISELGAIYYNKTKKEASFNLYHLGPSIRKAYPKIREKTWDVIEILISSFLEDDNLDPEAIIAYTATLVNIPESECKLQIVTALLVKLDKYISIFLDKNIHAEELSRHITLLSGYHKLQVYLNVDNTFPTQEVRPAMNPILQQQQIPLQMYQQPPVPQRQPGSSPRKAPAVVPRGDNVDLSNFRGNTVPKPQQFGGMMPQQAYPNYGPGYPQVNYGVNTVFGPPPANYGMSQQQPYGVPNIYTDATPI